MGGRFEGMRNAAVVEVARRRAPLVRIGGQRKGWAQGEEVSHLPSGVRSTPCPRRLAARTSRAPVVSP
jgi:hypothetical protein